MLAKCLHHKQNTDKTFSLLFLTPFCKTDVQYKQTVSGKENTESSLEKSELTLE